MIENGILHLKGYYEPWKVQIDLNELIATTGKQRNYRTTRRLEARRVLKFVLQNASIADLEWMDFHFQENDVLNNIWSKMREQK